MSSTGERKIKKKNSKKDHYFHEIQKKSEKVQMSNKNTRTIFIVR